MSNRCHQKATAGLTALLGLSVILACASPASAQQRYERDNLVSDIPGVALRTDSNLVNPWGIAFSSKGIIWINDNGTGVSTVYSENGVPQSLVVTIPPPGSAAPTGIVFNSSTNHSSFVVASGGKSGQAKFIFATEDGTISGWSPGVDPNNAILKVDNSASGAVYKGLAIANTGKETFIYATNFREGVVEQYDSGFKLVKKFKDMDPTLPSCNTNLNMPACFAPFGIQNINGQLFVTFALQDSKKHDDAAGQGNGFIDVLDTDGNLKRFASGTAVGGTLTELNSPWGLALAPKNFGEFSGALLVGNFGDGRINAFKLDDSGTFRGQLLDQIGNPLTIQGLWGLAFGNGSQAGKTNSLFFTAGIVDEGHGLFGVIRARENQHENGENQDENGENQDEN